MMMNLLVALAAVVASFAVARLARFGAAQSAAATRRVLAGFASFCLGTPPQLASFPLVSCGAGRSGVAAVCLPVLWSSAGKQLSCRVTTADTGTLAAAMRHGIELHEQIGGGERSKVYRGEPHLPRQVLLLCSIKYHACVTALA